MRAVFHGTRCARISSLARGMAQARNPYMGPGDNLQEYFDSKEELVSKAQQIAQILTYSNKAVVFCGAGISTKSGIPDYRSSAATVLPTGPGKWESDDKKAEYAQKKQAVTRKGEAAWPNNSHQALAALLNKKYLSHIVSQNVDGLFYRAGVPHSQVTEMHGNLYAMRCPTCYAYFWRDWNVPQWMTKDHNTDRVCSCASKSQLRDTIVYFGDSLHAPDVTKTKQVLEEADFIMVLGTSLKVAPSNFFVTSRAKQLAKDRVALVNLQKTQLHNKGHIEVHDFCDSFLSLVANELHLPLKEKTIERTLRLKNKDNSGLGSILHLEFESTGESGKPEYTQIESTKCFRLLRKSLGPNSQHKLLKGWPYQITPEDLVDYDSFEFSFEFLPEQKFSGKLSHLLEGKGYKYTFGYDWVAEFKSETLVD